MKLFKERNNVQTPNVSLIRSKSYFDPKKINTLYNPNITKLKYKRTENVRNSSPIENPLEFDKLKDEVIKLKSIINKRDIFTTNR